MADQSKLTNPSILLVPFNEDIFLFRTIRSTDDRKKMITLINPYHNDVAFRTMNYQRSKFFISPNVGIIKTLEPQDIELTFYSKSAEPGGITKFCIQFMPLKNIDMCLEEINPLFNGKYLSILKESIVICIFDDEENSYFGKAAIEGSSNVVQKINARMAETMKGDMDTLATSDESSTSSFACPISIEEMIKIRADRIKGGNLMLRLNFYRKLMTFLVSVLLFLILIAVLLLCVMRRRSYIAYKEYSGNKRNVMVLTDIQKS